MSRDAEQPGLARREFLAAAGLAVASPGAAVKAIEAAVDGFMGSTSPLDDQTLVMVRWQGPTAGGRLRCRD